MKDLPDRGAALRQRRSGRGRDRARAVRAAHRSQTRCCLPSRCSSARRSPPPSRSASRWPAAARRCRCHAPSISRRCCCSAANETMLVAAASAWSQCTFRTQVTLDAAPHAVQHGVARADREGGRLSSTPGSGAPPPGQSFTMLTIAKPLVGAATDLFRLQHRCSSRPPSACRPSSRSSASGTRTSSGARRATSSARVAAAAAAASVIERGGYWMASARRRAARTCIYRTYKVYMGRIQDQQRHVAAGVGPPPRDDRSAGARDRREGSDRAEPHPARAGVRRGLARALGMSENEIQGVKTAALLHDIGKLAVPEHILSKPGPLTQEEFQKIRDPPAGRRRDHQRRAVPVSGGAADPEPPRALGRQGLSGRAQGRGDSARRAHPLGRGLLRRADVGAAVSQGDELRRRDRPAAAGERQGARSARRARRSSTCIRRWPPRRKRARSRRGS